MVLDRTWLIIYITAWKTSARRTCCHVEFEAMYKRAKNLAAHFSPGASASAKLGDWLPTPSFLSTSLRNGRMGCANSPAWQFFFLLLLSRSQCTLILAKKEFLCTGYTVVYETKDGGFQQEEEAPICLPFRFTRFLRITSYLSPCILAYSQPYLHANSPTNYLNSNYIPVINY